MPIPDRLLFRLAARIRDQLLVLGTCRHDRVLKSVQDLVDIAEYARTGRGRLVLCLQRNWNAAAEKVMERLLADLRDLPFHVTQIEGAVESCKLEPPAVRDIFLDLQQTQEEFESFRYEKNEDLLIVTTEPIELDGVYLGEFEIQLKLAAIAEMERHSLAYRIVALDPHPATCNEAVTHPHVSDERLCEGDAAAAIATALANGRVCDFYQLVNAVLTNYNPNSPFVSLDEWEGRPCYDCGLNMGDDDGRWCSSCQHDFCEECSSYCRRCDESTCNSCLERCPVCDDPVCPSCLKACPDCKKPLCSSCLEGGECPCHEESKEDQEKENAPEPDQTQSPAGTGRAASPRIPAARRARARRTRTRRRRSTVA